VSDREPIRMMEDDQEAEGLRVDLSRAAEHDVGYDVAAGVAAFEATLASAPAGTEVAGSGGAAGGGLGTGKLLMILVGVAAVGGAIAVGVGGSSDEPAPVVAKAEPDPRPAIVPEPPAQEPAMPVQPTVASDPEPEPDSKPAPDLRSDPAPQPVAKDPKPAKVKPTAKPKPKPAPEPEPSPAVDRHKAEMEATNRARKALASNPGQALELARKADKEFPGGLFGEQRDGIKALALLAMGKTESGRKAGEAYLRKHPKGTYADKLRSKLEEKP